MEMTLKMVIFKFNQISVQFMPKPPIVSKYEPLFWNALIECECHYEKVPCPGTSRMNRESTNYGFNNTHF